MLKESIHETHKDLLLGVIWFVWNFIGSIIFQKIENAFFLHIKYEVLLTQFLNKYHFLCYLLRNNISQV